MICCSFPLVCSGGYFYSSCLGFSELPESEEWCLSQFRKTLSYFLPEFDFPVVFLTPPSGTLIRNVLEVLILSLPYVLIFSKNIFSSLFLCYLLGKVVLSFFQVTNSLFSCVSSSVLPTNQVSNFSY